MKRLLCLLTLLLFPAGAGATELERAVFQELNVVRTNPAAYVRHLEAFRTLFAGKSYRQPGSGTLIHTEEGLPAVDEAIAFLKRQKPVAALQWADGLAHSGAELVKNQGKNGVTGHGKGRDGMEKRILRHGHWTIAIGENVTYGPYQADRGREVVAQLVVDDGVPDRGHRRNIFNPQFRLVGVACGPHPQYDMVCVMDFAGGSE